MRDPTDPPHPSLGDGLERRRIKAEIARSLFDREASPESVGRFMVIDRLGAGGMGVVYRAYDPQLRREVALKLLTPGGADDPDRRERMVREAQAMARLQHPNLVQVFEVGEHEKQVFIAMELVEGRTLRQWLQREQRQWTDVVPVLRQAAQGLAAAHDGGLVHRDFKPENVMVGDDGRVRVMDFGLARETGATEPPTDADAAPGLREGAVTPLTRTGMVLGTPAYMSPEQHAGCTVDARSDQFSFCVVAWEALFGTRPFVGDTYATLVAHLQAGTIERPRRTEVPETIERLLRRGLERDPGSRHPDMAALVDDLAPPARRRWLGLGAAALCFAGLGAGALFLATREPLCPDPNEALVGLWDAEAQERVKAAIFDASETNARLRWDRGREKVDAWVQAWVDASQENCEATRVEQTQAVAAGQLRASCLNARLQELRALLRLTISGDLAMHFNVIAASMIGVDSCSHPRSAVLWPALPEDPAARRELETLREQVATMGFLSSLDQTRVDEIAARIGERVAASNDGPLYARFLLAKGTRSPAGWNEDLRSAYYEAERAGDDRTAALAAASHAQAHMGHDWDTAEQWREIALAKANRLQGDKLLRVVVDNRLNGASPDPAHRLASAERTAALARRTIGEDHPYMASVLNHLVFSHLDSGQYEEAATVGRRRVEHAAAVYGPHSREHTVAMLETMIALSMGRERSSCAEADGLEADVLLEGVVAELHPGRGYGSLAMAAFNCGRWTDYVRYMSKLFPELGDDAACHPFRDACPEGMGCYLAPEESVEMFPGGFVCLPACGDALPPRCAALDEAPCTYQNSRAPGEMCALPETVPGCAAPCCTPLCNLDAPADSCPTGRVCVPWHDLNGPVPVDFRNVGVCLGPEAAWAYSPLHWPPRP